LANAAVLHSDTLTLHNEWVKNHTPPGKFHMIELKDGWVPLCQILRRPVPDCPFPRANDADAVAELSKRIFFRTLMVWFVIFAGLGLLLLVFWYS